jgi:putative addiction module component (TIGR02574 family)
MTSLLRELSQRALALCPEERARLAEELLASVDLEPPSEVQQAWEIEVQRRLEEITKGSATVVPADDVHREARNLYQ